MAWKPSRRERILLFGPPKAGKSTTYIGIMDLARKTKTESHFWIIDNDNATEGIGLYEGGTYGELLGELVSEDYSEGVKKEYERATIWVPEDFTQYRAINQEIRRNARPQDWIVVDMVSNVWESMPDWWIDNVYGDDTWTYYADVRRAIENDEEGAGERNFGGQKGVDWQYIGKTYRRWEKELTLQAPCHVIMYASESEIQDRFDKSGEKQAQYKSTSGFAPKVEKGLPHRVHTYGRLTRRLARDGRTTASRELTIVGDRDRMAKWEEYKGLTIELGEGPRFGFDYLVKIAGWKLAGG